MLRIATKGTIRLHPLPNSDIKFKFEVAHTSVSSVGLLEFHFLALTRLASLDQERPVTITLQSCRYALLEHAVASYLAYRFLHLLNPRRMLQEWGLARVHAIAAAAR